MVYVARYLLCLSEKTFVGVFGKMKNKPLHRKYLNCTVPSMSIYDVGLSLLVLDDFMYFIIQAISGM